MPRVIAICGTMGSGKSTLVSTLRTKLPDCQSLHEDDHNSALLYSVDAVEQWWDRGADVTEFDLSPVANALRSTAATNVLLETQFGRLHPALREWIDLQIWLDVELDVAFARKVAQISRQFKEREDAASSVEPLNWLADFCDHYLQVTRKLFCQQREQVASQSDLRMDGTNSVTELADRIVNALEQ